MSASTARVVQMRKSTETAKAISPSMCRYQQAHIKTGNVVERTFGVWKRLFPCLDMGLQHKPKQAAVIITACAALQNFACLMKEPQPPIESAPIQDAPLARTSTTAARRPEHLPPVDAVSDSLSGMQARRVLIQKSFT
ncbi:uncharacterized protein LOC144114854 [Amblyomma americanum]